MKPTPVTCWPTRLTRTTALMALGAGGCIQTDIALQHTPLPVVALYPRAGGRAEQVTVGDLDLDGFADVLVLDTPCPGEAHALHLFRGGPSGFSKEVDIPWDRTDRGMPVAMGRWEPHAGESPRLIVVEEATQPGQWTLHALDIQGGVTRREVAHTLDTRQSWTSATVTLETQRPDGMAWITVHGISASGARAHRMFLWPSPDKAPALVGEVNEGNGQTYTWDAPMVPVDLDGDGATELVDVTFGTLTVLRPPQADEQGTQVVLEMPLTLASSPTQVTTGDFDGDGDEDLRVLQESCHDTLLENQDGRLVQRNTTLTYMDPTLSSVRADLTGDGRPELLLLGTQDGLVNVLGLGAQGEVVSQSIHRLVKASPSEGSQEGPRVGRVLHRLMDMEGARAAPPALYQHDRVHVGRGTLDPATVVALVANDGAVLVLQSR